MKIKLNTTIALQNGKKLVPTKFYEASERKGYYLLKFAKEHDVIVDDKYVAVVKE